MFSTGTKCLPNEKIICVNCNRQLSISKNATKLNCVSLSVAKLLDFKRTFYEQEE